MQEDSAKKYIEKCFLHSVLIILALLILNQLFLFLCMNTKYFFGLIYSWFHEIGSFTLVMNSYMYIPLYTGSWGNSIQKTQGSSTRKFGIVWFWVVFVDCRVNLWLYYTYSTDSTQSYAYLSISGVYSRRIKKVYFIVSTVGTYQKKIGIVHLFNIRDIVVSKWLPFKCLDFLEGEGISCFIFIIFRSWGFHL